MGGTILTRQMGWADDLTTETETELGSGEKGWGVPDAQPSRLGRLIDCLTRVGYPLKTPSQNCSLVRSIFSLLPWLIRNKIVTLVDSSCFPLANLYTLAPPLGPTPPHNLRSAFRALRS